MISVAVVTYNGETYLRAQLDSILANLSTGDEIVVSDDGSVDTTLDILRLYQEQDARIRVVQGPGEGVIANVEHALQECHGDYIFLADQDDVWMADKVDKVLKVFKEKDAVLVMHDARVMDADCREVLMPSFFAYRHSGRGAVKNIVKNTYMGCCMAFRREALDVILPIPKDIQMHDQWIGVRCDMRYHRTELLPEPLICYRRHERNVSDFTHNGVLQMIKNRLIFLKGILRSRG